MNVRSLTALSPHRSSPPHLQITAAAPALRSRGRVNLAVTRPDRKPNSAASSISSASVSAPATHAAHRSGLLRAAERELARHDHVRQVQRPPGRSTRRIRRTPPPCPARGSPHRSGLTDVHARIGDQQRPYTPARSRRHARGRPLPPPALPRAACRASCPRRSTGPARPRAARRAAIGARTARRDRGWSRRPRLRRSPAGCRRPRSARSRSGAVDRARPRRSRARSPRRLARGESETHRAALPPRARRSRAPVLAGAPHRIQSDRCVPWSPVSRRVRAVLRRGSR